jgi:methyl-accepting chemotaxis protein
VSSSSREIRGLVDEIRGAAGSAVMATEDGAKSVDLGGRQFDEVLVTFQQIAERVSEASVAARQIELGTKQQVTAVEQVNVAMGDVVRSAKETETGSAHTLETCAQLASVSRQLASFAGAEEAPGGR